MSKLMLSEKIRKARRDADLSQTELSVRIDVSLSSMQRIEDGTRTPDVFELKKIAEATGKNLSFFIDNHDFEIKNFATEQIPVVKVPVISWVSANRFGDAFDPFLPGEAEEWIFTSQKGNKLFALTVKSDCMEPEFVEGDRIIVNSEIVPNNGDYVIVRNNTKDEATFKQLKVYGNKLILHPLNPKYKDIELDKSHNYVIVGKVVGKDKKY